MERWALAAALAALAAALAFVLQRRRPGIATPPQQQSELPTAVDLAELSALGLTSAADTEHSGLIPTSASVAPDAERGDAERGDAEGGSAEGGNAERGDAEGGDAEGPAFVVFTEETCRTCAAALDTVRGPAGAGLPVTEVPFDAQRELHRRYRIHTVPTTLLVALDGQVVDGWLGPVTESELAAALSRR